MIITDGFFSGATLNTSDRLVTKIYAQNVTNQTRTFTFLTEGSQYYSFFLSTIPSYIDTYVTGFTYSNNNLTIKQNNNQTDLSVNISTMTGLTVNGGLTATTISATTYQNLPTDIRVTGGTYSNGTATFTNNTGGTFNVSGFYTGGTDVYPTGFTYSNNTFTISQSSGSSLTATINTVTGLTSTGILSASTISTPSFTANNNGVSATTVSATTYYGDGSYLTGIVKGGGGNGEHDRGPARVRGELEGGADRDLHRAKDRLLRPRDVLDAFRRGPALRVLLEVPLLVRKPAHEPR